MELFLFVVIVPITKLAKKKDQLPTKYKELLWKKQQEGLKSIIMCERSTKKKYQSVEFLSCVVEVLRFGKQVYLIDTSKSTTKDHHRANSPV